jgi:hypothetical protein
MESTETYAASLSPATESHRPFREQEREGMSTEEEDREEEGPLCTQSSVSTTSLCRHQPFLPPSTSLSSRRRPATTTTPPFWPDERERTDGLDPVVVAVVEGVVGGEIYGNPNSGVDTRREREGLDQLHRRNVWRVDTRGACCRHDEVRRRRREREKAPRRPHRLLLPSLLLPRTTRREYCEASTTRPPAVLKRSDLSSLFSPPHLQAGKKGECDGEKHSCDMLVHG